MTESNGFKFKRVFRSLIRQAEVTDSVRTTALRYLFRWEDHCRYLKTDVDDVPKLLLWLVQEGHLK